MIQDVQITKVDIDRRHISHLKMNEQDLKKSLEVCCEQRQVIRDQSKQIESCILKLAECEVSTKVEEMSDKCKELRKTIRDSSKSIDDTIHSLEVRLMVTLNCLIREIHHFFDVSHTLC